MLLPATFKLFYAKIQGNELLLSGSKLLVNYVP